MARHFFTFQNLPIGEKFYMKRTPDTCAADSISMVKLCEDFASSPEWGKSAILPDQPCWICVNSTIDSIAKI